MVKCPDCGKDCTETYDDAEIITCEQTHITIQYTRVIRCQQCGNFIQRNRTKVVPLP